MPKGLKETSGLITIGFVSQETVAGTMNETRIDLQLNVLDREVFVVYGVNVDLSPPEAIAATNTATFGSISTTSRTTVGNLSQSNVIATAGNQIEADAIFGVGFAYSSADAPATQLEYLGIIATNDFYAQVIGSNNVGVQTMSGRIYGVRAQASADIFAALTQSELLSA
jgi:hypothetical protein